MSKKDKPEKNQLKVQNVSYDEFMAHMDLENRNFKVKLDGLYFFASSNPKVGKKPLILIGVCTALIAFMLVRAKSQIELHQAYFGEFGLLVSIVIGLILIGACVGGLIFAIRTIKVRGMAELTATGEASVEARRQAFEKAVSRNYLSADRWP